MSWLESTGCVTICLRMQTWILGALVIGFFSGYVARKYIIWEPSHLWRKPP